MDFEFLQRLVVPRKIGQIVPPHRVYVCLRNLLSEGWMGPRQETIEILEFNEVPLLNDLGIDIRRSQRFNLRN